MRLSEYLEINKKLKEARTNSGFTQGEMAKKLGLSNSAYSNYENGYSEPPVEVLNAFCSEAGIELKDLLELDIKEKKRPPIETFTHILDDMIELQNIGINVSYSQTLDGMDLKGIYTFSSQQLATMGTGIEDLNRKLAAGEITEKEYDHNIENLRKMFNVPIKDFIY